MKELRKALGSKIELHDFEWEGLDGSRELAKAFDAYLAKAFEHHLKVVADDAVFYLPPATPETIADDEAVYPIEKGPVGQLFTDLGGLSIQFSLVEMIEGRAYAFTTHKPGGASEMVIDSPSAREFVDRLMVLKDCVDGIINEPSVVEYLNSKQEAG